ncbi:MAG TPA: 4Fe-4S binding protein [Candidatus Sulfomarinibacteraceae bacterium]|nr:4Fe-4S binding protein [Candidatus Sulfomarinibacteraceae bacterium]
MGERESKRLRLGTMLGDVARALVQPPATQRYPAERPEGAAASPRRLRGQLIWDPAQCVGCGLCSKECPANALEVFTLDRKAKRFVIRYHVDRCTFCGQCVESCRFGCLEMAADRWELAATDRSVFTLFYGEEENIAEVRESEEQLDEQPV